MGLCAPVKPGLTFATAFPRSKFSGMPQNRVNSRFPHTSLSETDERLDRSI
jgi:hypothetical protein